MGRTAMATSGTVLVRALWVQQLVPQHHLSFTDLNQKHPDFILEHSSSMEKELYDLFSRLLKMAQVLLNKVKDPLKGHFALNGAVTSGHPHREQLSINYPITSYDEIVITPNK